MLFGRRPREKEEHAFVRLIIIIPFVVVACVFYRLCDALTVREFYERECVHIRASLYIGDLPFLFVFGPQGGVPSVSRGNKEPLSGTRGAPWW